MRRYRTDSDWHHLAVTWRWDDGETQLYFDGNAQTPFWRSDAGSLENADPNKGGVEKKIGGHTSREGSGKHMSLLPPFAFEAISLEGNKIISHKISNVPDFPDG